MALFDFLFKGSKSEKDKRTPAGKSTSGETSAQKPTTPGTPAPAVRAALKTQPAAKTAGTVKLTPRTVPPPQTPERPPASTPTAMPAAKPVTVPREKVMPAEETATGDLDHIVSALQQIEQLISEEEDTEKKGARGRNMSPVPMRISNIAKFAAPLFAPDVKIPDDAQAEIYIRDLFSQLSRGRVRTTLKQLAQDIPSEYLRPDWEQLEDQEIAIPLPLIVQTLDPMELKKRTSSVAKEVAVDNIPTLFTAARPIPTAPVKAQPAAPKTAPPAVPVAKTATEKVVQAEPKAAPPTTAPKEAAAKVEEGLPAQKAAAQAATKPVTVQAPLVSAKPETPKPVVAPAQGAAPATARAQEPKIVSAPSAKTAPPPESIAAPKVATTHPPVPEAPKVPPAAPPPTVVPAKPVTTPSLSAAEPAVAAAGPTPLGLRKDHAETPPAPEQPKVIPPRPAQPAPFAPAASAVTQPPRAKAEMPPARPAAEAAAAPKAPSPTAEAMKPAPAQAVSPPPPVAPPGKITDMLLGLAKAPFAPPVAPPATPPTAPTPSAPPVAARPEAAAAPKTVRKEPVPVEPRKASAGKEAPAVEPVPALPPVVGSGRIPPLMHRGIDLNTAPADEITKHLEGIGHAMAERIVEDRKQNGPFYALYDLARVSGIGARLFERITGWKWHEDLYGQLNVVNQVLDKWDGGLPNLALVAQRFNTLSGFDACVIIHRDGHLLASSWDASFNQAMEAMGPQIVKRVAQYMKNVCPEELLSVTAFLQDRVVIFSQHEDIIFVGVRSPRALNRRHLQIVQGMAMALGKRFSGLRDAAVEESPSA